MRPLAASLLIGALATAGVHAQSNVVPRSPEQERASFRLPDGFEAELVLSEPHAPKVVDIAFDDFGRLWALTAVEYPLDANETPGAAEIYKKGGRDRVLVVDRPSEPGPHTPRVFAEGLAMPMALLPYGARCEKLLLGHGPEILELTDRDGDGKADQREVVLDGFGVEDSHLLPHRFTHAPGGWIYTAQGAFNYSRVRTRSGAVVPFDQCKLARFRPDGSAFEVVVTGLNNIWGIVVDRFGETWIQEANDLGYPAVRAEHGESYPGIGDHRFRPYSPFAPKQTSFEMGGTGLSGLALCEENPNFPEQWNDVIFVANPIARSVQALRIARSGARYSLEKLSDFLTTDDGMFRPIAIHFGPDGALYIVDWYCKIISHNEVSRSHPDRDKSYGRVWRVRRKDAQRAAGGAEHMGPHDLLAALASEHGWRARAALRRIWETKPSSLVPALRDLAMAQNRRSESLATSLRALAALEGLDALDREILDAALASEATAMRREACRMLGSLGLPPLDVRERLRAMRNDVSTVRLAAIRALDVMHDGSVDQVAALLQFVTAGDTYEGKLENTLVRAALESRRSAVAAHLRSSAGARLSPDVFRTALGTLEPAAGLEALLRRLESSPFDLGIEETSLLAQFVGDREVAALLARKLAHEKSRDAAVEAILSVAKANDVPEPLQRELVTALIRSSELNHVGWRSSATRAYSRFMLPSLAPLVQGIAQDTALASTQRVAAVRALASRPGCAPSVIREVAQKCVPGDELHQTCIEALARSAAVDAPSELLLLWPSLPSASRKRVAGSLASSASGARTLLQKLDSGEMTPDVVDADLLKRLRSVLPGDDSLDALEQEYAGRLRSVLSLRGADDDYWQHPVDLRGPFTVEAWVKLDTSVTNEDGILGSPGGADFNFADGRFRIYAGPETGDVILSKRKTEPNLWTHVAATRSASGKFTLFRNGELDTEEGKLSTADFLGLQVGRTTPSGGGTAGQLAEVRIWRTERSPSEIGGSFRREIASHPDLFLRVPGGGAPALHGNALIIATADAPALLSDEEAAELGRKLTKYRGLLAEGGDAERGREIFRQNCMVCHTAKGDGGKIGPTLDGAGWMNPESLLRAIVTPSAALEPGYRMLQVTTEDRELVEGLLVSQSEQTLVLRRANLPDLSIPRARVTSIAFLERSVMPDGLLDALPDSDTHALLAFVRSLR
ncbi:MAG: c-type cytochrome [Planctomycetes bacterium]|nr:c-type cytochrome [Planctomycetota bacterium]